MSLNPSPPIRSCCGGGVLLIMCAGSSSCDVCLVVSFFVVARVVLSVGVDCYYYDRDGSAGVGFLRWWDGGGQPTSSSPRYGS